jgi:MoaA/NifB/PqqE/SkfB family radical SAM enzyme
MLLTGIGQAAPEGVIDDITIGPHNLPEIKKRSPAHYRVIRFDSNNTCNLHCVYCHNARSDALVNLEDFHIFLGNVRSVAYFQIGCGMEPTLDKRLTDVMLMIADSPANPTSELILQTNGILIHRHDYEKMRRAGLRRLSVSIDAASPQTQKSLRDGTSLDKVIRNVASFVEQSPCVTVDFITTVTSENIGELDGLVELGLRLGVRRFVFREMFYYPDNPIVDHTRMPGLMLVPGQFMDFARRMSAKYETRTDLIFATVDFLHETSRNMHANSGVVALDSVSQPLRMSG